MHSSILGVTSVLISLSRAAALRSRALSGEATFYGGNLHGGTCSFSAYTLPSGIYGTALSDSNWADAASCGACISITGPAGNLVTAMIVDQCPGCGTNHLDLFPDAFAVLANPSTGVIETTWSYVECPITSPLQLHNKDGASQYWFSMQVINANKVVTSLEVSTDGGSIWSGTTRQSYNFFEYSSGFGTSTVDVKVTSVDGDVVIVNAVLVASGSLTTASGNFGSASPATDVSPAVTSAQAVAAEASAMSSPIATPTQDPTQSESTDAAGIFEPVLSSSEELLPTSTSTPLDDMVTTITTTMATICAQSTTSPVSATTVTVYSYKGCTN